MALICQIGMAIPCRSGYHVEPINPGESWSPLHWMPSSREADTLWERWQDPEASLP